MPLHNSSRVLPGTFHDFHYIWIASIRQMLNSGLLPDGNYAQAEQVAGSSIPDVLTLQDSRDLALKSSARPDSAIGLVEPPSKVQFTQDAEARLYAGKRDRIAVRHRSGDRIVALIDVVSPGEREQPGGTASLLRQTGLRSGSGNPQSDARCSFARTT